MSRIKEILSKKIERKKTLLASLDSIVDQLKAMGALKIVLFGSLLRDELDVNSDLDLFVVMPSVKKGKEWMDVIMTRSIGMSPQIIIVYNEKEFQQELPVNSFLKNILKGEWSMEKAS